MSRPLFAITEDFASLDRLLDQLDESAADEQTRASIEAELMGWLQSLNEEQRDKIDAYGWIIRRLESERDTARQVALDFEAKARARDNRVKYLKATLLEHMQRTEQQKLLGRQFTVSVTPNGGEKPLDIFGVEVLPEKYFYTPEPQPDNKKIREALEAGEEVPGARIKDRGVHLRIK